MMWAGSGEERTCFCTLPLSVYVCVCRGLKMLGVRDLSYRLAFLACAVVPTEARVSVS